jgi:beta-lactamase class A
MVLRHKTGSVETARIDVGVLRGPRAGVAYAVAVNWDSGDLRAEAIDGMRRIGERLRQYVTGLARDEASAPGDEPGATEPSGGA